LKNQVQPLYINDDEEKKDARDVKEPTGEKPAFKKAKQVQPVLRRYLRLHAKEAAKKEEEEKKDSKEDGSVLTDIETYSDSEYPEESGEASQGILHSIGGLFSRFSGAAANITESASSMVVKEMVNGVSHETEPTPLQDVISGPESREWIEAIQSEVCSLEENQTYQPCCLPPGRKAIPIKWVFKKKD